MRLGALALVVGLVVHGCGDDVDCPSGSVLSPEGRCVRATDASVDATVSCDGPSIFFYPDDDGDGFGDDARRTGPCEALEGYVSRGGDCDDTSADVNPSATERCNGIDDDCDGTIDEDALDPTRAELCNGADDDCDGAIDEGLIGPLGAPIVFASGDALPYGGVAILSRPSGYLVAWASIEEGALVVAWLSATGTLARGPLPVVTSFGESGNAPALAAIDETTAVVAYRHPNFVFASLLAEGEAPTVSVVVTAPSALPAVVYDPAAGRIVFAWRDTTGFSGRTLSRTLEDPSDEIALVTSGLFVDEQAPSLALAPADPPYALLGYQLTDAQDAFVDRVAIDPLAGQGSALSLEDGATTWDAVRLTSDARDSAALLYGPAIEVARFTPGAFSSAWSVTGSERIATSPGIGDIARGEAGFDVVHTRRRTDGSWDAVYRRVPDDGPSSGAIPFAVGGSIPAVSIARRSVNVSGVAFLSAAAGATSADVAFQRLGCE